MKNGKIKLAIDSDLGAVPLIGVTVNALCASVLPENEMPKQIELCVVEAVNNSIKHAYGGVSGRDVEVIVEFAGDKIVFQVCDSGKPMKPRPAEATGPKFDPGKLETFPEGGMGLFIIRNTMDAVSYKTLSDRNVLTMTKYFY